MPKFFMQYLLVSAICCLAATFTHAAGENTSIYVSTNFIAGISELSKIKSRGAATPTPISNKVDDAVGGFSAAVGYQWGMFHIEAEYLWRYRFDFDNTYNNPTTSIKSNVETKSFLLNTRWAYENRTKLTPYLGGGLGWAGHEAISKRSGNFSKLKTSTDNFVWSLKFGLIYSLSYHWNVDVSYSYADLGDVNIGPFTDSASINSKYTSSDFSFGINYHY